MKTIDDVNRHIIYAYCSKNDGCIKYIGQRSGSLAKRAGKNGSGYYSQHVYEWITEIGWENIEEIILESNLSQNDANVKETYYIKLYNTIYPNGYNMDYGGHSNSCHSTERSVIQFFNGNIVNVFRNVTQAAQAIGISPTTLDKYCKTEKVLDGYKFTYRSIEPDIFNILVLNNNITCLHDAKNKICKKWTNEEISYIKSSYIFRTEEEIANNINRTVGAVKDKIRELGIKRTQYWSDDECKLLIDKYNSDRENIYLFFPDRSESAIKHKALKLGLIDSKKWTQEMDEIIRMYYPLEGGNVYKRIKGKSKYACQIRASMLGVKVTDWNDLKKSLLITLCNEKSNLKDIAKELRISVPTLKIKMHEFGISKVERNVSSKYKFVYYDKSREKWRIKFPKEINCKSKQFDKEMDAALFCKNICDNNGIAYSI